MIICFQPGGSVKDKRAVMRWEEKIPYSLNVSETEIYRESEDDPRIWILVKPVGEVLPLDSPLLKDAPITESTILDLTKDLGSGSEFEHRDIIRMDDDSTPES